MTLTVSQLNRYVKSVLEEDSNLKDVYLKAEISNFTNHFRSGHFYFTLKDEKSSIKSVMFRGYAEHIKFKPEEGMEVLVRGSVSLYEIGGSYQFYVTDMQPFGIGSMEVALRQLKDKLSKKGYFNDETKKELPNYPNKIGVITSKTGAAIGDIKEVISRRYPVAKILFAPAIVQGKEAPLSLINGIHALDKKCDVIIIGRGGGSKEDLWAFNDEQLADTIFYSSTPIISAVGHEMDVTICDMVSDHRAPTPSAAAELAVPDQMNLRHNLSSMKLQFHQILLSKIRGYEEELDRLVEQPALKYPDFFIKLKQERLDFLTENMYTIQRRYFDNLGHGIREKALLLDSLNPIRVLARGYSVVYKNEKPVTSVKEISKKDLIKITLEDGQMTAKIIDIC